MKALKIWDASKGEPLESYIGALECHSEITKVKTLSYDIESEKPRMVAFFTKTLTTKLKASKIYKKKAKSKKKKHKPNLRVVQTHHGEEIIDFNKPNDWPKYKGKDASKKES